MTDPKSKNLDDLFLSAASPSERVVFDWLPNNMPFPAAGKAYEDGYAKGYADGLTAQSKKLVDDDGHGSAKAHYLALKDQLETDHFDDYATIGAVSGRYVVASSRVAAVHAFRLQHGEEAAWAFHIGTTRVT
jgi:hypothetical protein